MRISWKCSNDVLFQSGLLKLGSTKVADTCHPDAYWFADQLNGNRFMCTYKNWEHCLPPCWRSDARAHLRLLLGAHSCVHSVAQQANCLNCSIQTIYSLLLVAKDLLLRLILINWLIKNSFVRFFPSLPSKGNPCSYHIGCFIPFIFFARVERIRSSWTWTFAYYLLVIISLLIVQTNPKSIRWAKVRIIEILHGKTNS